MNKSTIWPVTLVIPWKMEMHVQIWVMATRPWNLPYKRPNVHPKNSLAWLRDSVILPVQRTPHPTRSCGHFRELALKSVRLDALSLAKGPNCTLVLLVVKNRCAIQDGEEEKWLRLMRQELCWISFRSFTFSFTFLNYVFFSKKTSLLNVCDY